MKNSQARIRFKWIFRFQLALLFLFPLNLFAATQELFVSISTDRSNPVVLQGQTVSGAIYVFTGPEAGASRVSFYLDDPGMTGSPVQVENLAPYDFAGSNGSAGAKPYDTTGLTDGSHEITALIALSSGGIETVSAEFSVANQQLTPVLTFSADALVFTAEQGGTAAAQMIDLDTNDNTSASYAVSDNAPWLIATPLAGTTPAALIVSVDAANLAPNTYTATITGTAGGYVQDTVSVTLTIKGPNAYDLLLSPTPDRTNPLSLQGTNVSGNIYVFTGPEAGASRVSFYLDDPGMTGSPVQVENLAPYDFAGSNGSAGAKPYDTTGLNDGSHEITAQILLAGGGSETVGATFIVANNQQPLPAIAADPGSLVFSVAQGGTASTRTVDFGTNNNTIASCTVVDNAAWLMATPSAGTTPASLVVSVDAAGLAPGTYTAMITISAAGYVSGNVSVSLAVTGTVASNYGVLSSLSPDRSNPVMLQGQTVSGAIYVFTGPEAGASRVSFYLDDPGMTGNPVQVENLAPYDFAGSNGSAGARPLYTTGLTDGLHVITAQILLIGGGSETVGATFTVANDTSTPLELPFFDNFNDGNANGWTIFDDTPYPTDWQVDGGTLNQNISDAPRETLLGSYHRGTYTYLDGGKDLTDYRLRATLIPLDGEGEEIGHDIGVMFRYRDNDNYYRLSFNSNKGFTRLEKKYQGQFTTLAKNARGYVSGEPLDVAIAVTGDSIQVVVNDDPLFGAVDGDIASGTVALYAQEKSQFDEVRIEDIPADPAVVIATPLAYSVGTADMVEASAVAVNAPPGGSVQFVLDGVASQTDADFPYTAQFAGISQGEHVLDAILRNASSAEVAGDTNDVVGVLGDAYVAVGDSLTNGVFDNYLVNNLSFDERIYSLQGGYVSTLSDLLTDSTAYPNIIFNEGVPGDETYDAANLRIDSILERHPETNRILILLGTNDSGGSIPVPSGLNCLGTTCNNTVKGNLKELLNKINDPQVDPPKDITVALIPPAFNSDGTPNATRNQAVMDYNKVIRQSDANPLQGYRVGPDLFNFYLDQETTPPINRSSLFANRLHPNAFGHVMNAYLWHNAIHPGNSRRLPFHLEEVLPLGYRQNLLEVGDRYYLDRSYTLTSLPSELTGEDVIWIMTRNDDKNNRSAAYISFRMAEPGTVYVAYDSRATALPGWLRSGFSPTGMQVGVSETMGHFNIYTKSVLPGSVSLGGNQASGAAGVSTNYLVMVKKN